MRKIKCFELKKTKSIYPNFDSFISLDENLIKTIKVKGIWSENNLFIKFNSSEIEAIKKENFDILLRCGSGILKGKILTTPKFGILSFHHGDNRVNRGGPPGFWEVLNKEVTSGFVIQQLSSELDGGKVLFRGNIRTSKFWLLNYAFLLEKSHVFMINLLIKIQKEKKLFFEDDIYLHHNPLYKLNQNPFLLIKYIYKIYGPLFLKKLKNIFSENTVPRWSIGYCKNTGLNTSLFRYKEIENPPGRFFADPFVITINGNSICFVEDYFYSDRKGRISAIELNGDNYEFKGIVLEENFHLSYPFIVKDEDDIYMIPECNNSNEIRLYKCKNFPMEWEFETTLMDNVSASDTSIMKKNNLWYMFTNICSAKIGDHLSELHIFYSEKLNTKNWKPLKLNNPIIFDSSRARNAGMFKINDKIIRVNQKHDKFYGSSFVLNKVIELSPEKYFEAPMDNVYPNFKNNILATHHFHLDDNYSVIDFMRLSEI